MTKLNRLIKEAKESCEHREHEMSRFAHTKSQTQAFSVCLACGYYVAVKTEPLPNEINIGGNAVALYCTS